jgi:4-hydroxybenzoate polyprenyltransferase
MNNQRVPVRAYVLATHFPQALTMVALATVVTLFLGLSGWNILFVVIATASGQASVGWVNDYLDAHVDKSLDRKLKPVVRHSLKPEKLKLPITIALLLAIPFSFLAAGWEGGIAHLGAIGSAQLYNRYLSRTVWSWLPYALSFSLLPIFCWQAASRNLWPSWNIVLISSLVGVIAHIFNALPDFEIDKRVGYGGLVVYLGKKKSLVLLAILSLALVALLFQLLVG